MTTATPKRKLIEVALPLAEINDASAYDKLPGIGPHPKGIHQWWARLPLPAARAMLFASVIDDPSEHPEKWPTEEVQNSERKRLFKIIEMLMQKKLHQHAEIYETARIEMLKHCGGKLPTVFDPFSGGGSIPLEASRMGFETQAGDLNPVAVLLNKFNLEIAPRWNGSSPVNPQANKNIRGLETWYGTTGLSNDLRYYGNRVYERAVTKVGDLYPQASLPTEQKRGRANVIAYVWARTVVSPNPAAQGKKVPLISTYWLSSVKGKETWLEPVVNKNNGEYSFKVRTGTPTDRKLISSGTKDGRVGFRCLLTDTPIRFGYLRNEGRLGRIEFEMLAIVAELPRGRTYLVPDQEQIAAAQTLPPDNFPDTDLPDEALGFRVQNYGIKKHWQMFTNRQLKIMVVLSDLIREVHDDIRRDAVKAGLQEAEADSYSLSVVTMLAFAADRTADFGNNLCRWSPSNQKVMNLFGRQAVPMIWDFAEANTLGSSVGSWLTCVGYVADCVETIAVGAPNVGTARQLNASSGPDGLSQLLVSTDPPYYDNIGYAALSDFFYVWLRRTLGDQYPELFSTVLVPKMPELIASAERFGGRKDKARDHFEVGFRNAFTALHAKMDYRFPLTVYYAFKQDDEENEPLDVTDRKAKLDLTTGWETLLEALVVSGFQITGTWPVRASQAWRMRAMGSNALASYIVLSCRPRAEHTPAASRREFVSLLRRELPNALRELQKSNIAPVDLAQASIGPGMAVFSRYQKVLESDGRPMPVRAALTIINQMLDEVLAEQEGEFDSDTRWALAWFEQFGVNEGVFGDAETLSKAKNTSVSGMVKAGIIKSGGNKVRLLRRSELLEDWNPQLDGDVPVWEATQHLVKRLEEGGEEKAAALLAALGSTAEIARDLAYRLYSLCERKKWAQEALAYNALVSVWPELTKLAANLPQEPTVTQPSAFGDD